MHRSAIIKKCREQDKKPGRKYPVSKQEYCLWDHDEEEILMAGPESAVKKQEKNVQYFKHQGDVCILVQGKVYRRSSDFPQVPRGWEKFLRMGYSGSAVFDRLRGYVSKIGRKVEKFNAMMGDFVVAMDRREPIDYPSWGQALGNVMDSDKFAEFAGQVAEALKANSEFSTEMANQLLKIGQYWAKRNALLTAAYDMEQQIDKVRDQFSDEQNKAFRMMFDHLEAMQKDYKKSWRSME